MSDNFHYRFHGLLMVRVGVDFGHADVLLATTDARRFGYGTIPRSDRRSTRLLRIERDPDMTGELY
jgi:hypothetical protein